MAIETLFIGRNRITLPKIDSTNNYALQNPVFPEGTVISADFQTGGKGQRGKVWASEPGQNLLFSIVLKPSFLHPSRQFSLNKAITWSVYATVKQLLPGHECAIKWPNDIYVNGRKLAGILSESQLSAGQIVSYVAGIGLNLNQEEFHGIRPEPVSMKNLAGVAFESETVLAEICGRVEAAYLALKRGDFDTIDKQFNEALWKKGEEIDYVYEGQEIKGRVLETDRQGRLVILNSSGLQYYQTGEISWII